MRVPFRESWRLRGIERELRRSEQHLAGMLAVFARLNAGEAILNRERVRRPGDRARVVLAVLVGAISGLAGAAGRVSRRAVRLCAAAGHRVSRTVRATLRTPSGTRHRTVAGGSLR